MKRFSVLAACAGCLAVGFVAGGLAANEAAMIVTPFGQARFQPVDPKRPEGAQIAVLRGDPATGPSAMLMRLVQGASALHVHSSDYDLVVIEGEMRHSGATQSQHESAVLGPGSYWFQPGNEPHSDACLSDECLMYVQWSGKRDGRLAEAR